MKIKLVSIEEGITALGFRKIAAIARELNPDTEIYFIPTGNLYSLLTHLFPARKDKIDTEKIAEELAKADLLCFSSMSPSAPYVEEIARAVKQINPNTFILWGGTHPIISPTEAIKSVDAICKGKGEGFFETFYRNFAKTDKTITSNPHLYYRTDCWIYDKGFRRFTYKDYLKYNGLAYRTVWTVGCPFSCSYCANDAFLRIDPEYGRIKHCSVNHIIEEIEIARKIYPFISTVVFYDDNFISLPEDTIREFAQEYKKRVGLPFVVFGMHPNLVTKDKVELLAEAGMNRARMGIQSGCEKTLAFYNRPTTLEKIKESATILSEAAKKYKMIPPAFDIISDNPIETKEDIRQTLKFLYELKRPYTLTIFSLRAFPNTKLWDYFKDLPTNSYLETKKSMTNILLYTLAIFKPPRLIFNFLLRHIDKQNLPVLYLIIKSIYLFSRAVSHLKRLDFTTIVGPWGYYLWKAGFINRNKRAFN